MNKLRTDKLPHGLNSQAEIDAQYNPSLRVANPAQEMEHYRAKALLARERLPCVLDVPYGPTRAETLDIFLAREALPQGAPVFIFIHGGYWRSFSASDFSGVALGLQTLGIMTVVVNYALCPKVDLDEITRQARAAVAWVVRNIARHGGDPLRVAVGGHSAGGHLAAMCLQTDWVEDYGLDQDPLRAALLVSGLYELAPLRWSYLQPQIQLDEGLVERNSPARNVRPCTTPIWVTWGGNESSEFARQSKLFHDAWTAAGNTAELREVAGANHFSAIHGFEDGQHELCTWLQERLRSDPSKRSAMEQR